MIRKAMPADFAAVQRLYQTGAAHQAANGLDQWRYGIYPSDDIVREDIQNECLYLIAQDDLIQGAFAINTRYDPEYDDIAWLFGVNPLYLHRMVILPDLQGQGLASAALEWIKDEALKRGHDCLRLDAYSRNESALRLYTRFEMRRAGEVFFAHREAPFICMEKALASDCPLLPIPMTPAFRFGKDTPWGGEKLQTLFHKPIPDNHTGESLEVSALPGLNSQSPAGEAFSDLINQYREKLLGKGWDKPFPLLLKLIDAREPLSVQVHPDDVYAGRNENGKLGKEEAWVVLQADPGAELVYGVNPAVTRDMLKEALQCGGAVERLMRRVTVNPMDVLFIPAGCIHAIGGGITLYEIQQSSDVTYRFYDYDRVDKNGQKRELHIEKALDVCDTAVALSPIPAPQAPGITRVLDKRRFILDSALVQGELAIPKPPAYALLTVLEDMTLVLGAARLAAVKGQTFFLPASCPAVTLAGEGRALIALPPKEGLYA